jgi:hypothetical protein
MEAEEDFDSVCEYVRLDFALKALTPETGM